MSYLRLVGLLIKFVVLLVPALKCLPRPSIAELHSAYKLIYPYVRKLRFPSIEISKFNEQLTKINNWLETHQGFVVKLAKLCTSAVEFIKRLIDLLVSKLFVVVRKVVTKVTSLATATKKILLTKLW